MNLSRHFPTVDFPVFPAFIDVQGRARRNWTLEPAFPSLEMERAAFLVVNLAQSQVIWKAFTMPELEAHSNAHGFPWGSRATYFEGFNQLVTARFIIRVGEGEYRATCEFILACFGVAPKPNMAEPADRAKAGAV